MAPQRSSRITRSTGSRGPRVLEEFTCFPSLPKELRLQIWEAASFITRTIDLRMVLNPKILRDFPPINTGRYVRPYSWESKCLPPAVLHTNAESRAEAQKWYSLEFGVKYRFHDFSTPATVFINWRADRIFLTGLDARGFGRLTAARDFQETISKNKLRFMAYSDVPNTYQHLRSLALCKPTLEELILVGADDNPFPETHRGHMVFYGVSGSAEANLAATKMGVEQAWARLVNTGYRAVRSTEVGQNNGDAKPRLEIKTMGFVL